MLIVRANIKFYKNEIKYNLSTERALRPAFDFGNGMLFSGELKPDQELKEIVPGIEYELDISFFTIDNEAYEAVSRFIKKGSNLKIHTGSKIIGEGCIKNFTYE
jgi:hypothetical protein